MAKSEITNDIRNALLQNLLEISENGKTIQGHVTADWKVFNHILMPIFFK